VTQQGWDSAEEHLRQAMETAIANPRGNSINKRGGGKKKKQSKGDQDKEKRSIETLSAAASAQNLAVFLKARAMTADPYHQAMMEEAKKLYVDVERVRSQLLPAQHPDVYATKYSLAELLEAMGDTEAANGLRQEIIDTYDPPSSSPSSQEETATGESILPAAAESESSSSADADEENNPKREKRVVVESTSVAKSQ
jgi:hypothetical protein